MFETQFTPPPMPAFRLDAFALALVDTLRDPGMALAVLIVLAGAAFIISLRVADVREARARERRSLVESASRRCVAESMVRFDQARSARNCRMGLHRFDSAVSTRCLDCGAPLVVAHHQPVVH